MLNRTMFFSSRLVNSWKRKYKSMVTLQQQGLDDDMVRVAHLRAPGDLLPSQLPVQFLSSDSKLLH